MTYSSKIRILWAQTADFPAYWFIKAHTHKYYHLFFVERGPLEFYLDGEKVVAEEGVCVIVAPGVLHEVTENHPPDAMVSEIKFNILDPYIIEHIKPGTHILKNTGFIGDVISYVTRQWISRDVQTQENIDSLMRAFLIHIICKDEDKKRLRYSRYIDNDSFNELTKNVISYIEQHYREPLRLDALADRMGYSKSHLCSVFMKNTGYTIVEYLNYIRIRMAAECLSYTGMDIFTTSRYMGFGSVGYFSRKFKALVGISPSKFRRIFPICENGSIGNLLDTDSIFTKQAADLSEAYEQLRELGEIAKQIDPSGIKNEPGTQIYLRKGHTHRTVDTARPLRERPEDGQ